MRVISGQYGASSPFTIPAQCTACGEYFPAVFGGRRPICPLCGSIHVRMADIDEVIV